MYTDRYIILIHPTYLVSNEVSIRMISQSLIFKWDNNITGISVDSNIYILAQRKAILIFESLISPSISGVIKKTDTCVKSHKLIFK